ncbi:MAG: hypothetical protein GX811_07910, partial [Lentisphaerae bacterium]|nr:hypothetical protein [Lentisphaerota bacterium]
MKRNNLTNLPAEPDFVIAAQFYREPHIALEELKKDMARVKKLGLNTIKIQEAWSYDEPVEGKFEFDIMDELASSAADAGLNIFYTICLEVPAWAWKKFPNAHTINEANQRRNSYDAYGYTDGKPGPCWNHKGMRDAATRFMTEFIGHTGKHRNVVQWQAYQELNWLKQTSQCFCPECIKLFRKWLKKRYGSLETLESKWLIPSRSWDEIEPTRRRSGASYKDWWDFSREQMISMLKWRADTMRSADPFKRPISVNVSGPQFADEWEWKLADNADICGTSFYPAYFHTTPIPGVSKDTIPTAETQLPHDMWHTCLWFDYLRVATKGQPWASEFQAGPPGSFLHHGNDPSPADMSRWLLLTLSAGVKGISFWNHRPEYWAGEGHRYGIFDRTLEPTPKTEEITAIANAIEKHGKLIKSAQPAGVEVAILVNEDNTRVMETKQSNAAENSMQGLYRTLWDLGVHADFLASTDLASGKIKEYKIAFMPFPIAMSDEYALMLKNFVEEGGILVSEACPGRYSDRDTANLETGFAPQLDSVFGCRNASIRM